MKKSLLFLSVLVLFGMFSFVLAVSDNSNNNKSEAIPTLYAVDSENNTNLTQTKNMTYGSCVSQYAKVKNDCYSAAKQVNSACIESAKNETNKNSAKQCKLDLAKSKKQCKADFKVAKKGICAEIKHNFLETISSSLK